MTRRVGLVVPVGPDEMGHELRELLESLAAYESTPCVCVLIDNGATARPLCARLRPFVPSDWELVALANPHRSVGVALEGSLCCDVLAALKVLTRFDLEFIVRLDTDAMIIAPFVQRVCDRLGSRPGTGVLGTIGRTCRREAPDYGFERHRRSSVIALAASMASLPIGSIVKGCGPFTESMRDGCVSVRGDVDEAVANGYDWFEYAQGGAYVITRELLDRLERRGVLDRAHAWIPMPVGEDVMMGMYARSAGLSVEDYSAPGEPFANHWRGLAYPATVLVQRGCSLVHSVRNDPEASQEHIRDYFRARRSGRRGRQLECRAP